MFRRARWRAWRVFSGAVPYFCMHLPRGGASPLCLFVYFLFPVVAFGRVFEYVYSTVLPHLFA